jgi:tellurite methyltransferase
MSDPKLADEERWRKFMAATIGQPPWPELVRAADLFETPGEALDVGAGAGRDTAYLLARGWRVTALDSSPFAAEALQRLAHTNLRVVITPAQDFVPSDYDLVNAQFSLPFIPRDHFAATVARFRESLRTGGVMAATFFGKHDEWNVPGNSLNFSTQKEVEQLFSGLELIELTEVERDGNTADGSPKHWHVFHLTARRRADGAPRDAKRMGRRATR